MYVFLSGAGCKLRVMCVYINGIMLTEYSSQSHSLETVQCSEWMCSAASCFYHMQHAKISANNLGNRILSSPLPRLKTEYSFH